MFNTNDPMMKRMRVAVESNRLNDLIEPKRLDRIIFSLLSLPVRLQNIESTSNNVIIGELSEDSKNVLTNEIIRLINQKLCQK